MVERAMDMLAAELGMDPADLRRRNLIAPDRFPYTTAGGATYDSGDYAKALDNLLEVSAYRTLRTEQARRRERGDRLQLGIGLSVYVEVTAVGIGPEWGAARAPCSMAARPCTRLLSKCVIKRATWHRTCSKPIPKTSSLSAEW